PIVNPADERRNQGYPGFGARNGLGEAKEQCQIAVDAFLLKKLGCANSLPGAGDLDQDAVARHALVLIKQDELAGLGDRTRGVKAQSGGNLGRNPPGDDLENFTSKKDEKTVDELFRHFFVIAAALQGKFSSLFH